jgi:serine/threonine protein kinase
MREFSDTLAACPYCGHPADGIVANGNQLPEGTILMGRYVIGGVAGFGGFGITYTGYDFKLERPVAIKEYLPSDLANRIAGSTQISAFTGEAQTYFHSGLEDFANEARRLVVFADHPNIVHIYDTFEANGTAYITMELLWGTTVKALLAANGKQSYAQARAIMLPVLDALEAIHAQGIIHRDIAPDNIFITAEKVVKLIDFGAARHTISEKTRSMTVILKPGFAPEEQYRSNGTQGQWTDVYAAAATFYKLLTGVTPEESLERLVQDTVVPPSELGAQLPQFAETAIMTAMRVKATDRTQTAAEFKQGLMRES